MADNIDFKKPEDGEIVLRMYNLAKERNIAYTPTHQSCIACLDYCTRKNIPHPPGLGGPDGPVPQYVPQPAPMDYNNLDVAPGQGAGGMQALPGAPMAGSIDMQAPPMGPPGGMPVYNPQPQQQQMYQTALFDR